MKEEWLVIANKWVAVNVAEVMYTSPVVPRELAGLKTEYVHMQAGPCLVFLTFCIKRMRAYAVCPPRLLEPRGNTGGFGRARSYEPLSAGWGL